MKKTFFVIAAVFAIFMTSCSSESTTEVTVLGKSQKGLASIRNKTSNLLGAGVVTCDVVTPSGDTVQAQISEARWLKVPKPCLGKMAKNLGR